MRIFMAAQAAYYDGRWNEARSRSKDEYDPGMSVWRFVAAKPPRVASHVSRMGKKFDSGFSCGDRDHYDHASTSWRHDRGLSMIGIGTERWSARMIS